MIENIKNAIYQSLNELFVNTTMDELTGDFPAYKEKLKTIARVAEILNIDTEITSVSINIKTGETIVDVVVPETDGTEPGIEISIK